MKVLLTTLVYPDEFGFLGGIFIHSQARALKNAGADVAVLYVDMRSVRKKRPWGYSNYELDGIKVYRYALPCGPFRSVVYKVAPSLACKLYSRIVPQFGMPDVVHAHFWEGGLLAKAIKERWGVPVVVTEHGSGIIKEQLTSKEKQLAATVYDCADTLIAVGGALKSCMRNMTRKEVIVVPNFLPDYMKEQKPIAHDGFVIITVGHLISRKNHEATINALKEVTDKYHDSTLILVGSGTLKNQLVQQANKLGVAHCVKWIDSVPNEELPHLYAQADVFALPSKFETFGVVYAEAIACGLPVIATDCGGPRDIVDKDNGILVPTDDQQAYTKAVLAMHEGYKQYDRKSISENMQKRFSEIKLTEELTKVYNGCTRRPAP